MVAEIDNSTWHGPGEQQVSANGAGVSITA